MNKKFLSILLIFSLFLMLSCSYSFAATTAGNAVMDAGNGVGNAVSDTAGAVANGAKSLGNGVATMWDDVTNANGDKENDGTNTMAGSMFGNNDGDYTATRTATGNNNMLGMSDTTWTWIILGIVGLAIVGLVWYYGAQYEHRSYNND